MFIMYSKQDCAFCARALRLIEKYGDEAKVIDVNEDPEIQQQIDNGTWPFRTVPVLYDEEKFVGGYEDLEEYLLKGPWYTG